MKKISIILFLISILASCQQEQKKSEDQTAVPTVLTVDQVEQKGSNLVGKEVVVTGTVSHVCKHSGQRCFLMGSTEDQTIRVEAGHGIGSFNQEQMGSDLKVKGILREIRIDDAYIATMEAEITEDDRATDKNHAMGHAGEGNHEVDGGDHTGDQMKQIVEMRQKIEATGKGYYSVFYLDGTQSEELE